jgi:alkylation response protein AidB-like acyl-CoA dehydrogenase
MSANPFLDTIDSCDLPIPAEERSRILDARKVAEALAPRAATYDRENRFPRENFDDLQREGFLALRIPREYGGAAVSELCYAGVVFEIGKADAATALCFTMHSTAMTLIDDLASPEQKARVFGEVIQSGHRFSALGSEPHASIFSGKLPSTELVRRPSGYVLRGKKAWCSWGPNADRMYVDATLDGAVRGVVVKMGAPGVNVRGDWDTLSMRGTQSMNIDFEDVAVAEEDVMARPSTLLHEFEYMVGLCSAYLGLAAAAHEQARKSATESMARILASEVGHGHPDAGRLFTTIGELKLSLQPAWLMVQRAAQSGRVGTLDRAFRQAAAKYVVAEAVAKVTTQGMRVVGAKGLDKRQPMERLFRDAQAAQVMALKPDHAAYIAGRFELGVPPEGLRITDSPTGFALSPENF